MAQGPPVFPSFKISAPDEDEQYFAGLRAAPDEDDPFGRPRRDDSWARHPSGGWETTGSDRYAAEPTTSTPSGHGPTSSTPLRAASRRAPVSEEIRRVRLRRRPGEPHGDDRRRLRCRRSSRGAGRDRHRGSARGTGEFDGRSGRRSTCATRRSSTTIRPRRRGDRVERGRPAADPWGDQPDDRLSDAYAVPEIDDLPEPGDPYLDDPYRRSDILRRVAHRPEPAGRRAARRSRRSRTTGRRPRRLSGNRLLTVLLFFAGLATSVSLWLFDTQAGAINDTATLMLAAGRITGLIAGYLLFIQLLMMSRVSWLEEWVGARDLLRWHRWLGTSLVVTVLAHIVFIVYGYALTAAVRRGRPGLDDHHHVPGHDQRGRRHRHPGRDQPDLDPVRPAPSCRTSSGTCMHLAGYLVLLLGYGHQVATGADLSGRFASVFWPGLSRPGDRRAGLGPAGRAALAQRCGTASRWPRWSPRAPTRSPSTSTASNLDRLPAQAGQFMRWRFLTRNGWWQSHPFSLSAAPNTEWLRLTVTAVGGHTARLAEMQPGTPVWAEGPFGTFTAQRRTRRRALLIAGGSGIAPIRALLEDMPPDTIVIYRASRPDELVFRGELEDLAERRDAWVRYIVGSRNDPGPRRLFTAERPARPGARREPPRRLPVRPARAGRRRGGAPCANWTCRTASCTSTPSSSDPTGSFRDAT